MTSSRRARLRLARVTLKQHRFELIVAVLASLVVAAWAGSVMLQLDEVGLPPGCLETFARSGEGGVSGACASGVERAARILGSQGEQVFGATGLLPFVVGVVVAVPIVGRELEAGTAQTAWSQDALRTRWLRRRVWPVALVAGIAVVTTAVSTEVLAGLDQALGRSGLALLGSAGLPVLARLLAAFGLGLLVGALIPRELPALVVGLGLCLVVLLWIGQVRDAWVRAQVPVMHAAAPAERLWLDTTWAWQAPDGGILTRAEGRALVPADVVALDTGDAEETSSWYWLQSRGYEPIPMGIPERDAMGWYVWEPLLYGVTGTVAILAAFVVVDRRRPT